MKRIISACLLSLALPMLFATGTTEKVQETKERVVTTVCRSTYATQEWYQQMNADFTAETGINVEVEPTPGTGDDNVLKINVDLLAGGDIDVVSTLGPRNFQARIDAGFFLPLDEELSKRNIDVANIWGKYAQKQSDGNIYALPYKQEIFCLFYNKNVFDNAGVAYPTAPWTWDDYEATCKAIQENSSDDVYGAFSQFDNPWLYMMAAQKGVPFYKADGTSNFDDPAFAEALKWYKSMSDDKGYQMGIKELKAKGVEWDYYATQDNLGMFIQGNWFTRLLNSQNDYPKDWNYGMVALPSGTSDNSKNNFVAMGYLSVNKNAAHLDEAIEYLTWRAQNQWKYEGGIPALVNLTEEENASVFQTTADASNGSITAEDLNKALVNNGLGIVQSDIIGTACFEYSNIIKEEMENYCYGSQSLDKTINNIVARTNEAISNAE